MYVGGKFTKKNEAVLNNLKKMEDIHYELNLLKRGGKNGMITRDAHLSNVLNDSEV